MSRRRNVVLAFVALAAFAAAVFLAKPEASSLPATDAATHAALAMSATAQGWAPHFPIGADAYGGFWGEGYNDHPFFFFYLNGWIMRALGPSAFSAKLLPCGLAIGCVLLTAWLGLILRSAVAGVLAGLVLALTRDFVIDGVNCHLDDAMTFFILASFIAWVRGRWILGAVLAGVGMWFKNPVALLVVPWALLANPREWRRAVMGGAIALAVGLLVWVPPGILGGFSVVRDYWVRQLWGTAVEGRGGTMRLDPLLFFRILRSHYMPWTILLVLSLGWIAKRRAWREPWVKVPGIAALVVVAAVSLVRFKYDHYYVPVYPFLALLAALPLARYFEKREAGFFFGFELATLGLLVVLLCTPVQTAPESFPAFKRFAALIQSYGECSDRVVFVEGGQPYGAFVDYLPLLNFYTGRHAVSAGCEDASRAALAADVAWVLIAGENFEHCLSADARARFPRVFLSGNQYLLTRRIPVAATVDLTPLERELRAPVDCAAAPLPRDRYHAYLGQ
jgi:hypothetical protein